MPQINQSKFDATSLPAIAAPARRGQAELLIVVDEVGLPAVPDPRLFMLGDPSSRQAGRYRLLRDRLVAYSDPRVIAVTSVWPREGKTTCAANLALVLAEEAPARVLLVDANVPRPGLARLFGFEPTHGFAAGLAQQQDAALPFSVVAIRGTRLHVAALCSATDRSLRLDRLTLGATLEKLRQAYDYIVIDGASVLESADADVAGDCAEGVVVATRPANPERDRLVARDSIN